MKKIFKQVIGFFKKRPNLFVLIVLALVVFASYGLTLKMYWWVDDWGLLFKMIHPESAPGNLGAGIWGDGAYRFLATPFIFLYPTLGRNPTLYFALGLLQYLALSYLIYLLVKKISRDFLVSLSSGLIFASGYMGSYALYRLSNSYQLIDTALMMVLTVYLLISYFQTKKLKLYLISIILFTSTMEFLFLRAQGIVFVVLAAFILFSKNKFNFKNISLNFLRLAPFLIIYYYYYFSPNALGRGSMDNTSNAFVQKIINSVFRQGNFSVIYNFFANFANLIIPYDFSRFLYTKISVVRSVNFDNFLGLVGLILFGGINLLSLCLWLKKKTSFKLILFGEIFLIANYVGYYLYNPNVNLFSTTRYLIPSFVGSSILFSAMLCGFGILKDKLKGIRRFPGLIFVGLIVYSFISLTRGEERAIIGYASIPTKQAYEIVKKTVSKVDEKTLFLFELEDNGPLKGNLLGGMGQLGISIFFNYNGETKIADTYDEVFYLLDSRKYLIDNLYGFYGGTKNGFISFTDKFRKLLTFGGAEKKLSGWRSRTGGEQSRGGFITETKIAKSNSVGTVGVNPALEVETNYDSMVPTELTLSMRISPLAAPSEFPFRDVTMSFHASESLDLLPDFNPPNEKKTGKSTIVQALKEEAERQEFLKTSKVTTSSSWKDREAVYLKDDNLDTNWNAHIGLWNTGKRPEEIFIDLGKIKTVSKLMWINNQPANTPIDYNISFSNDGKTWFKRINGTNKVMRDSLEMVTEKFVPTPARFLKISINDTYSGNSPSIVELWTSGLPGDLNFQNNEEITKCPLCFVQNLGAYRDITFYQNRAATARLWWVTNRNEKYYLPYSVAFPVFIDGRTHVYHLIIPAQGTMLEKIKIDSFNAPVNIVIENATVRLLSLNEIKERGLIHKIGGEDIRLNK